MVVKNETPPQMVLLQEHHLNAYNCKNMASDVKFMLNS
jgi:hypothetical protein